MKNILTPISNYNYIDDIDGHEPSDFLVDLALHGKLAERTRRLICTAQENGLDLDLSRLLRRELRKALPKIEAELYRKIFN